MTFPVRYSDIPSSKNYPTVGETLSGKILIIPLTKKGMGRLPIFYNCG